MMNGFRPTGKPAGKPARATGGDEWIHTSMLPPGGLCAQAQLDLYDMIWMELDAAGDSRPDQMLRGAAKRLCAQCPMLMPCLARSLLRPVTHGILGGMTYKERQYAMRVVIVHDVLPGRKAADLAQPYRRLLDWLDAHPEIHSIVRNRRRNERARKTGNGEPLGRPRRLTRLEPGERDPPETPDEQAQPDTSAKK
ncbi:WhiB family transcriptional regulator [Bifidobacterium reuteri]|uniref:WhiB family transcriptional regulator n=1 Tax=Bifidobacterium reuteri TaxID=983706 RepID=A0A5J5E2S9_9BIFI|nr:WhiB family transcriptional regulator [Bifidobacterium reuteri]KAA8823378.1 WhiB family transcriptional regulator [Bifidobacterium reuteri]